MPVRRVCLDHLTLPVTDAAASAAFYRAALVDGLGWRELVFDGRSTFGPEGHNVEAVFNTDRPGPPED